MKKLPLILAAALLMAGTSVATAQDQPPMRQQGRGGNMMGMLLQGITLTADQQTKVDSISAKYREQMMAMRQDQSIDQDTRRSKSRELMTKQSDEIKALLTDEQKKVFEKNLADMEARRQQMGAPGAQRPPQR